MIVVFSTMTGISLSTDLKKKCAIAQLLCKFADEVALLMDFKLTSTGDILRHISQDERFSSLEFVKTYDMEKKSPVKTNLDKTDDRELASFLAELGTTDIENQLRLVKTYRAFAESRKDHFQKEYEKRRKLYMAFGVSGGLVLALMLA